MAEVAVATERLETLGLSNGEAIPAKNSNLEEFGKGMRKYFMFDEKYTNLNHGSFGTHPSFVRSKLQDFQLASERRPDHFTRNEYPKHLDVSRAALANYLNVNVDTLVLVPNATIGVNTVLRSLRFVPGDKIVYFNFIYVACEKTINYIEETTPAKGVRIDSVKFPCSDEELVQVFKDTIIANGGGILADPAKGRAEGESRVRVAIFDSVVSMPGIRLPFEKLIQVCKNLGVFSLVDGAHGIGHIPIDLGALDPDFFVSNCHKWLYVPRSCAVFHVPLRNQHLITSLPTSHGYIPRAPPTAPINNPLPPSPLPKSPWVTMFEWVGTIDYSPYLCIPAALQFRSEVCGGEKRVMEYCRDIVKRGADIIAEILGTEALDNDEGTLGNCCLRNVRLPLGVKGHEGRYISPVEAKGQGTVYLVETADVEKVTNLLTQNMMEEFDTFIAVVVYHGNWYARVSGQTYLDEDDFRYGGRVLKELVDRIKGGAAL